ncbi:MAG TPA: two-component regulator propeller domain-containing protein [Puia sp.]|nr:two-component regulator propeller domain-containing protein [Puia sp.]
MPAQPVSSIGCLGIDQGLSNNSVNSIFKDHSGLMWFGTYDGLNRYDGYDFKIFRHKSGDSTSIVNNWVGALGEDSLYRLWVGTANGVSIYDPVHANFHLVPYEPADGGKLQSIDGNISNIVTSPSGDVFIGTAIHGLLVCPKGRSVARQVRLPGHDGPVECFASAISVYANNIFVSIRDKGIFQYREAGGDLVLVSSLPKNNLCLQADNKKHLWIGADDGLYVYDLTDGTTRQVFRSSNRVVNLTLDRSNLWIASDGDGVLIKHIDTGEVRTLFNARGKPQLSSSGVYSIFHDNQQRTWIGTIRGGINIIDSRKSRFLALVHDPLNSNSLVDDCVLSCIEDKIGNLWIGTDGGGVSYYNRRTGQFSNYRSQPGKGALSNDFVTSLLNDDEDNVWLGTWTGGINRFNKKTNGFDHYPCLNVRTGKEDKNIFSLFQDSKKDIWAGACVDGALYKLNKAAGRFEAFDTTLRNIVTLYEDADGQLWGGDYTSLIRIDRQHKKHVRYAIGFSVRSIYEDARRNFWVGTQGNGLLLFNRASGKYSSFTEDNGLANNAVLQIVPDDKGNLWLSTFKGISVFSMLTGRFNTIAQSDGLLSNQLSVHAALRLRSGEFGFGGIKGMNIFFPDKIQALREEHTILLSNISINNTPSERNSPLIMSADHDGVSAMRLPYDKAVLSLTFVSPEYSTPDKISYAYYLQGWDKDWNYPGRNRTATYTRLQEGSYVFKVKVADAYNNWSEATTLLKITVLPPWFRTWWAYVLYVIAAAGVIYIVFHYRARQIKLQYEVAFAQSKIEREKELNEKKLSFFTDVAHEFRSPLTLIVGPVKELIARFEHKPETKELNTVYRNAKRLLSLVNQLLLFRKADVDEDSLIVQKINLFELCNEVYSCFWQQARVKNIRYDLVCHNKDLEVYGDYEKLEIVLFNLISNALKFTPDGGTVLVTVRESGLDTEVVIEDSGCGIDQGQDVFRKFSRSGNRQARSGFGIGLYLARKFTEAHQGELTYESVPGQGTVFTLSLQRGFSHLKYGLSEETVTGKPELIEELSEDFTGQGETEIAVPDEKATVPEDFLYGRRTILVVDDDPEVRQYLRQILSAKYFVKEAEDGETALEMIFQKAPDLIISDVVMKELNGVELCRRVKEHQELTHTPVILLTSSGSDEAKLNGIKCGADDYILKPFDKLFLLARIDNIFKIRSALQQYFLQTITLQKVTPKVSAEYRDFLQRCIEIVEEYIDKDDFSIKLLAKEIGMSHSGLYKKIKMISGLSAASFIRFIRLRRAAVLMLTKNVKINEAAFQVGITDAKYFREQFKKLFGMNPSEYIKHYRHSFENDLNLS